MRLQRCLGWGGCCWSGDTDFAVDDLLVATLSGMGRVLLGRQPPPRVEPVLGCNAVWEGGGVAGFGFPSEVGFLLCRVATLSGMGRVLLGANQSIDGITPLQRCRWWGGPCWGVRLLCERPTPRQYAHACCPVHRLVSA